MVSRAISRWILSAKGWTLLWRDQFPDKCVICVAPHTSNWDFIYGQLTSVALQLRSRFLMKKEWFFFPMGYLLRALGGIPVNRGKNRSLVDAMIEEFGNHNVLRLSITPEGTRKRTSKWKKGFYHIALGAKIPILMAYIDYEKKEIGLTELFTPTGDQEKDFDFIRNFYKDKTGLIPQNFTLPE